MMGEEIITGTIIILKPQKEGELSGAKVVWHDNGKVVDLYKAFSGWFKELGEETGMEVVLE